MSETMVKIGKPRTDRWNITLFILSIGLFLYSIRGVIGRLNKGGRLDFYHFYHGSRAVADGTDLYASGSGGYIYPPFFAWMLSPISGLSHNAAALCWLAVNVILIILILFLGFRVLQRGFHLQCTRWQAIGMLSLAVLLTSEQIRWELILGQTDTLTLAGFALCLFWLERWPVAAGMALGLVMNVKYQALGVLPYLLFRARWLAAFGLVFGFVIFALLPALTIGWEKNLGYLATAFGGMAAMVGIEGGPAAAVPDLLWERSITITSGIARMCVAAGHPESLAFPLVAVVAGLTGLILWAMFHKHGVPFLWRTPSKLGDPAKETGVVCIEWIALLTGLLIFSPQGTKRHMFLLLSVHVFVAMLLWFPRPGVKRGVLISGVLIAQLGMRLPSKDFSETAAAAWNHIGGPSWSILVLLLCTVWAGLAYWSDVHRKIVEK